MFRLTLVLTSILSAFSTLGFFVLRGARLGGTSSSPEEGVLWICGVVSDSLSDEEVGDQESRGGKGGTAF